MQAVSCSNKKCTAVAWQYSWCVQNPTSLVPCFGLIQAPAHSLPEQDAYTQTSAIGMHKLVRGNRVLCCIAQVLKLHDNSL